MAKKPVREVVIDGLRYRVTLCSKCKQWVRKDRMVSGVYCYRCGRDRGMRYSK